MDIKSLIFSRGILKNRNIEIFISDVNCITRNLYTSDITNVIGWGFKPTAKRARDYAAKNNLPYIALEDGFIRSVGLGVEGTQPLSLVVDEVGIYYDARQPSKLEQLIIANETLSDELLLRSQRVINAIKYYRLSKYNQHRSDADLIIQKPQVVVIDQTVGDASVDGAMANAQSFIDMLYAAITAHPNETIWVKVHPDVICGKKKGFLYPLPFEHPNIRVYAESVNPWDFLDSAQHVYTVSSLMGFEALMAGCQVYCFGMPFYAGWGLTQDQQQVDRRNLSRSLEQVFAAAYFQYARYVDPILGQRCELEQIINIVIDEFALQQKPSTNITFSAISWWKKRWIGDFLSAWKMEQSDNRESALLGWGLKEPQQHTYTIEDGFIRSVGLGVHFNRPISLVCDRSGIYFDATRPSDLESLLNTKVMSEWDLYRAQQLIEQLNQSQITKYNVGHHSTLQLPQDKTLILVPGQVEGDASIRYGSPKIKTNAQLLAASRAANPDAYIIYKPHPDVLAGQRDNGNWQGDFQQYADLTVTDVSMATLLKQVDEIHTMTSLTGFEALLRGKKVVTYGMPFYAGWGLTTDKCHCPRRNQPQTLTTLVAMVLIYYPVYVDPISRKPCNIEQALMRVTQLKAGDYQVKDTRLKYLLALKKSKRTLKSLLRLS
ncbi:capsular polysaccharide biosynthesis protein [Photobacterium sp. Alg240-V54]|uniref:capsular polysaccharide biosynthesis protein n=1 Tax=Photobacterium sp. Alg240-V54 TaxID=2305995 RepID=UPI0013D4BBF4|nr:capsular polysaccharide biosynthesis protein [Photobacterium sp. Alg240-V54]